MRSKPEWVDATIASVRDVAPSIREIGLSVPGGGGVYATGSHIEVMTMTDGRPAIRHYSLVGDRARDGLWRIAVKREEPGRGGSRYMWSLVPGARLELSRPTSHFELTNGSVERLLIAGGIGITPILGMAEALVRRGSPLRVAYAGRTRATMAYLDELQTIAGDALIVATDDERGLDLAGEIARLSPAGECYVCGPIGLLEGVRTAWRDAGRPQSNLIYESFGTSGRHPSEPFIVRIPRRDIAVEVAANTSILEALEAAGVGVLADCRRGECGLCQMDVLEVDGDIDHRDVFFSDEQHHENQRLCVCVSRISGGGSVSLDPAWRGDKRMRSGVELGRDGQ